MKIAKKVLAVVMAVAMIAALSAMAFAATEPKVVLKGGAIESDGYFPVTLALKDAIGAKAVKIDLVYDAAVLDFDSDTDDGTDAAALKNTKNNKDNVGATNGTVAGKIEYGYAFANSLLTAEEFAKDAQRGKEVKVNSEEFSFTVLGFMVKDSKAASTDVKYTADIDGKVIEGTVTLKLKEDQSSSKPADVVTTEKEEVKTTNPPTGNDDKKTGDNMALAAAAGVVALAGVAFIISKKRK